MTLNKNPIYGISLGGNGISLCDFFRSPFLSVWYEAEDGFPPQFYATSKLLENCDLEEANRRISTLIFLFNGARRVVEGGQWFYPACIDFLAEPQGAFHADGLIKSVFENNCFSNVAAIRTIKDKEIWIKEIFDLSFFNQLIGDVVLLYGTCVSYCVDDLQTSILKWSNIYKIYDNIKYALSKYHVKITDFMDAEALDAFTYSCNNSGVNWITGRHGNDGKAVSKKIKPMNLNEAMAFIDLMVKCFLCIYKKKLKEELLNTTKEEMLSVLANALEKVAQKKYMREQFNKDVAVDQSALLE